MSHETSHLIDAYLEQRERGLEPDVEALVSQAGDAGPELRARLETLQALEGLGELLDDHGEPPSIPERLNHYKLLHPLGQGGVAQVYLARDEKLERTVALKVLSVSSLSTAELSAVAREGRALAALNDPGIVAVHGIDVFEGFPFVVMEYVDGPSLYQVLLALHALEADDPASELSPEVTPAALAAARAASALGVRCVLIAQIARALHTCHLAGIVHRDVKPGNILLDAEHQPKLADFGMAHMDAPEDSRGHTQALVGTPGYVAPEQVDQQRTGASPASDQFSLGVVLYEMLTLQHPFRKESRAATMTAISEARPVPPRRLVPSVPRDLERICLHCLEREPEDRYPNLAALADDLEAFVSDRPIGLRAPSVARRLQLGMRRNRVRLLRSLALLLALAVVATGLWLASLRSRRSAWRETDAGTREALASCESSSEMVRLFQASGQQREAARGLQTLGLDWLFPSLVPGSEETLERCSLRLHELVSAAQKNALTFVEKEQAIVTYRPALELDRRLCSESTHNATDRDRGYVSFVPAEPDEVAKLFRVSGSYDESRLLTDVSANLSAGAEVRLDPGVYRIEYRPQGGEDPPRIREFEVRPDLPLQEIRCSEPHPSTRGPRITVLGDDGSPAFELSADFVTWSELHELLPERCLFLLGAVRGEWTWEEVAHLPANPTWHDAFEFAALAGARLPQLFELERAAAQGMPGIDGQAEWTATPADDRERYCFTYGFDGRKFYRRQGLVKPMGFRLAFSLR